MKKHKVAVYKCPEYNLDDVEQKLNEIFSHFGGVSSLIKPGQRVLIKPNFLAADAVDKLTCTHPVVLEGIIKLVKKAGGIAYLGDRPTVGSSQKVARVSGVADACQRHGVEIVRFGKGKSYKIDNENKIYLSQAADEYDVIINAAKLKVHAQLTLSLGVKNLFGFMSLPRRVHQHLAAKEDVDAFARMLLNVYQIIKPAFTIVDGITAMEREGPRGGDPRQAGLLFGGDNAVAVDRVSCEVLGLAYMNLPTLKAAHELGVSGWDIDDITVCGEDIHKVKIPNFKFPKLSSISFEVNRSVKILVRQILNTILRKT